MNTVSQIESNKKSATTLQGFLKIVMKELWDHLPVWIITYNMINMAYMAMTCFNPSRPIYILTALFPLFWTVLYLYARYSTNPISNLKPIRITGIIAGIILLIMGLFAFFAQPKWDREVVTPIEHFYPNSSVDQRGNILNVDGTPVLDNNGTALKKNTEIVAPDNHTYKVEGKLLIDLDHKKELATRTEIMNVISTITCVLNKF
ncbi:hypothetical protein [Sphingobacterium siyangense]|uniref:Uncharacterized protein n=1 Tax=Sphingobacterium siyangense TaxID=459529 RepID=A0A562LZJ6_9SPHI|nr:hypothetical protein [Sphingobacterium siyangense]TWI13079.1 hypothetical protein IQ31_05517 [Sphingobacterium siyangense]